MVDDLEVAQQGCLWCISITPSPSSILLFFIQYPIIPRSLIYLLCRKSLHKKVTRLHLRPTVLTCIPDHMFVNSSRPQNTRPRSGSGRMTSPQHRWRNTTCPVIEQQIISFDLIKTFVYTIIYYSSIKFEQCSGSDQMISLMHRRKNTTFPVKEKTISFDLIKKFD